VASLTTHLPLCRLAKPNPLNDRYNLPCHPHRKGFKLTDTTAEKMQEILALLSSSPLIDIGLLSCLRKELNWSGSELESQIWNHPDIKQGGLGICL
jgi:hypothetical protein